MPFIEKDALNNSDAPTPGASFIPAHPHDHAPLKSFIATPRMDDGLWQKFRSLFKSELKPGQYITRSKADGLRYMFIITSNSYQDRDDETITSKALEQYEASCYPGEGLFYCDNPLLWWHDDDVPMGEIVAVNYSTPFLVEVAKELPTPTARILWDYAEANGDNAGASHRFGYREEDRQPDGSYTSIIKQESSYLPERQLAANLMTYAGVINKEMSTTQSDQRLNEIFAQATGGKIQNAAAKIHAKSGELDKELAALGITHKAKASVDGTEEMPPTDETAAENPPAEDEKEAPLPADFLQKLQQMERIYQMMMEIVGAQGSMAEDMGAAMEREEALVKSIKSLEDKLATREKAASDLEQRIAMLEARANMTPRRASQTKETTLTPAELADLQRQAEKANITTHPVFGVEVDPSKNPFKRGE